MSSLLSNFARHASRAMRVFWIRSSCIWDFVLALHPPSSRDHARVREVGAFGQFSGALPRRGRCTIHAYLYLRYRTDGLFKMTLEDADAGLLLMPDGKRKRFVMTNVKDESVSGVQHAFGVAMSCTGSLFHVDRSIHYWFHGCTDWHGTALPTRRGRGALSSSDANGEGTR